MRALTACLLVSTVGLVAVGAPPAQAGGAGEDHLLAAAVYNTTPYSMNLVDYYSQYGWQTQPSSAAPGANPVYVMGGSDTIGGGLFCPTSWQNTYNGWMTYRVDVLGGAPEYITIAIFGVRSESDSLGCAGKFNAGTTYPEIDVWNTTAPPPARWDPWATRTAPAPLTAKPQVAYQHNVPYLFDQTFSAVGDWTVDANTPLGRSYESMLNTFCAAKTDTCDFQQTGDLTWGIGTPTGQGADTNCPDSPKGSAYETFTYEVASSASLSVGGGVEVSTEANLFDIIKSKISVSVEAEHEWEQTESFSRDAKVFVPLGYTGALWTAPTIGTVTGTLTFKTPTSTFTVLNFRQVRSGVTRDKLTPPYNVMALTRPATRAELSKVCGLPRSREGDPAGAATRSTLVPGRGVGRLRLGAPRDTQVVGRPALRAPLSNRSATANDCTLVDTRCRMAPGRGGTWVYDDGTAVVFDADHLVTAVIHTGRARTSRGIGVGSRLRDVRAAYPAASCEGLVGATTCILRSTDASGPVDTMFHLTEQKGRTVVEKVIIHRVDTSRRGRTS